MNAYCSAKKHLQDYLENNCLDYQRDANNTYMKILTIVKSKLPNQFTLPNVNAVLFYTERW
jgi:hypothetical protein